MANEANKQDGKVWFITGASTGFGRLLAEEVLKAGGRVIATARKPDQIVELEHRFPKTARSSRCAAPTGPSPTAARLLSQVNPIRGSSA